VEPRHHQFVRVCTICAFVNQIDAVNSLKHEYNGEANGSGK